MVTQTSQYINREISWLHFNERVLQEAMDESTPLLERLKFLGIFSNNRDEFFRVRVGTLNRMALYGKGNYYMDGDPEETLRMIDRIVEKQEKKFTATYDEIVEALKAYNIHIISEKDLNPEQGIFVSAYFSEHVRVHLFPMMINNLQDWTILKDNSIYLAVVLSKDEDEEHDEYALIKVPTSQISRFVTLPSNGGCYIMLLDDVIRYCLSDIFSVLGYNRFSAYTIKFTKDAELDIDNDISKSFLEIISESVKQRKKGKTVRFVYDREIPPRLLKKVMKKLRISANDRVRGGGRYHNFKDFMNFPNVGPPELYYPPLKALEHPDLPLNKSILDIMREKDVLLHYPYQSFHHVTDLLREASMDPRVRAIKMTFYRVAKDSSVMNALINAVRNGKEVIVFLEVQARFDEESNIYWAGRLQDEGVRIIKTIPGIKVHAKMILIRRKEDDKNVYYANISTGNYNESTAKVYSDTSLLTSRQEITTEVNRLFHLLEESYHQSQFSHLIVAPFNMRKRFLQMINREIRNAKAGLPAWMHLKMNNLVDTEIIKKLYQASNAGVKIKIIVRGICVLVPSVPGLSENIEATSIVDRYLEHTRIFIFANGGKPEYYISSADWMQRNFDHRIEIACPVYDEKVREELQNMLDIQIKANVKARIISADHPNQYKNRKTEVVRAQSEFYQYLSQRNQ